MDNLKWEPLIDGESEIEVEPINKLADYVNKLNKDKVDKVDGKGLSTNDFTNEDKEKVAKSVSADTLNEKIKILDNYANAIKGTASGEVISIKDISPLEHEMSVKLSSDTVTDFSNVTLTKYSENLIDYSKIYATYGTCDVSGSRITFTRDDTNPGTNYGDLRVVIGKVKNFVGKKITFSFNYDEYEGANTSVSFNTMIYAGTAGEDGVIESMGVQLTAKSITLGRQLVLTYTVPDEDSNGNNIENKDLILRLYVGRVANIAGEYIIVDKLQAAFGEIVTKWQEGNKLKTYTPNADGTVNGVTSLYPATILSTDTDDVIIEAEYNKDTNSFAKEIKDNINDNLACSGNILYEKKYVAIGDSFTAGSGTFEKFTDGLYKGKLKVYPYLIGRRNNMDVVNMAVAGSTMTNLNDEAQTRLQFSKEEYQNIPLDTDYITIKYGINDKNQTAPIGTIDDTENTTFYGAWNVVLEWIVTNLPFAKVGIIVSNGMVGRIEYNEAVRNIAKKWGIPYLDEDNGEQVPLLHLTNKDVCDAVNNLKRAEFGMSASDGHPNEKAHEYESTFIETWLRTL